MQTISCDHCDYRQFVDARVSRHPAETYPGEKAFRLYDTYGLPRDFIADVVRDAGLHVDWAGFERAMQEQRTRARASWKGAHKDVANPVYAKLAETYRTEPDFYFGTTRERLPHRGHRHQGRRGE